MRRSTGNRDQAIILTLLDTGMRASEVRSLRRRDLVLDWEKGVIKKGEVIVSRSKTAAGTGRAIPLTQRICATLTLWLSHFPEATAEALRALDNEVRRSEYQARVQAIRALDSGDLEAGADPRGGRGVGRHP